jgi:hypothetical protein
MVTGTITLRRLIASWRFGQPEVENHSGVTGCRYRGESLGRRRQKVGFITCRLEALRQELRKLLVVLNQ